VVPGYAEPMVYTALALRRTRCCHGTQHAVAAHPSPATGCASVCACETSSRAHWSSVERSKSCTAHGSESLALSGTRKETLSDPGRQTRRQNLGRRPFALETRTHTGQVMRKHIIDLVSKGYRASRASSLVSGQTANTIPNTKPNRYDNVK
jgi:hypothetical protein